ncbi:hypothetical protein NM688_g1997 [Phlebia brevispora]|uniref:Uncharacterized protein n=1 Tax=Phlebia brevispora TaxID=194682 RepID=A0ACC1T9Q9_9APHY|nr:hypothetical protein NM688_g1997 [Phlebia brevispora]
MSTSLNFTIDDSSPVFSYSPYGDGSLLGGWQAWFSGSGFETEPQGGEESVGDSYHLTNFSGASVSLEFYGTAIYLYGNASCTYEVNLDNSIATFNPLPSSGNLLFSADRLGDTLHTVNLTARPSDTTQEIAFDKAVVTNDVPDQTTSLIIDNQNTTVLQYRGQWSVTSDPQVPDKQHPSPFHDSILAGDSVALNFTGAVAVAINASTNYGHGQYNVTLNGTTSTYNGSTWWLVGNTVLAFKSGLDPSKPYTLELVNAISPYKLTLSSFTLYGSNVSVGSVGSSSINNSPTSASTSVSTTSSSPSTPPDQAATRRHTNAGVIAGPVVAGVVVIIVAVVLLLWRRRVLAKRDARRLPSPYSEPASSTPPLPKAVLEKLTATRLTSEPSAVSSTNPDVDPTQTGAITGATAPPNSTNEVPRESAGHPAGGGIDLNQIIELIAQRIDRPSHAPDPSAPPPRYLEPVLIFSASCHIGLYYISLYHSLRSFRIYATSIARKIFKRRYDLRYNGGLWHRPTPVSLITGKNVGWASS